VCLALKFLKAREVAVIPPSTGKGEGSRRPQFGHEPVQLPLVQNTEHTSLPHWFTQL